MSVFKCNGPKVSICTISNIANTTKSRKRLLRKFLIHSPLSNVLYGSDIWTTNTMGTIILYAIQIRSLRPLLSCTALDSRKNFGFSNTLKQESVLGDLKLHHNNARYSLKETSSAESSNLREDGMWADLDKDGNAENVLSFNETCLYT
jgi:hypothetical protein